MRRWMPGMFAVLLGADEVMKQYVEEKTGGNFVINIFPNSQLAAEEESLAQVQTGSIEMATASIGPVTTFQKKFFVLDIPFLFNSYNEAWMVMDSKVGQDLLASLEECGMKGLAYMENGFRHLNPGSVSLPKGGTPRGYIVMGEDGSVRFMDLD